MIENELVSAKEELPIVAFETESMEPDGINRVAVIGSGVMGAGIAAQCANAGCEVLLLDIVPEGASRIPTMTTTTNISTSVKACSRDLLIPSFIDLTCCSLLLSVRSTTA